MWDILNFHLGNYTFFITVNALENSLVKKPTDIALSGALPLAGAQQGFGGAAEAAQCSPGRAGGTRLLLSSMCVRAEWGEETGQ